MFNVQWRADAATDISLTFPHNVIIFHNWRRGNVFFFVDPQLQESDSHLTGLLTVRWTLANDK